MLHMVNTHGKFPGDAKHNAYYAADGLDVGDATKEEVEKYRLVALHKRNKPDIDAPGRKSESSTSAVQADQHDTDKQHRRNEESRGQDSSRDREKDRGSRNREAEVKDSRMSSRDAKKEKSTSSVERRRTDDKKDERSKEKSTSSVERRRTDDKKDERSKKKNTSSVERRRADDKRDDRAKGKGTSSTSHDELDEEERDMRKMEEIQRRMEGRRAARESERAHAGIGGEKQLKSTLPSAYGSEASQNIDASVRGGMEAVGERGVSKMASFTPRELMAADIEQRKLARKWASESISDTAVVTQSTTDRGSVRQKAVKKAAEKIKAMSKEIVAQSLVNQEAIASQYPPIIDESVSSTVRLGRALVSGALGKRNDDPKLFEATVELQECSVVLHSTRKKAKAPVSAPPPNSIDSDVEGEDQYDVVMSQSTADTGVNIELPGCVPETAEEKMEVEAVKDQNDRRGDNRDKETVAGEVYIAMSEPSLADIPTAPGTVATPVLSLSDEVEMTSSFRDTLRTEVTGDSVMEIASTSVKDKEMRPDERRRILHDVDKAELMRKEIWKTNPEFASVSSILGAVCGENRMTMKDKAKDELAIGKASVEGGKQSTKKDIQQEISRVEKERCEETMTSADEKVDGECEMEILENPETVVIGDVEM